MGAYGRLRVWLSLFVAAGTLFVAIGVALLLNNTVGLRDTSNATLSSETYLLRTVNVERLVVDGETGLRGYLVTGHTLFLQPLHSADTQLPRAEATLLEAAKATHAFAGRARALVVAVRSYISHYVPDVLGTAGRNLQAARSFALTLEGKQRVDAIRVQAGALEGLISARLAGRERTAHSSADRSIVEAIVVLILLTLLTAVIGAVLGHLVVERERAQHRSEAISSVLQQSLLPAELPSISRCELASRFIPAAGMVGGDFYDVFELAPASWAIVLGDVCGKGAAAAALTGMVRWTLRTLLESGSAPDDALRAVNEAMLREDADGRFATAVCIRLVVAPEKAYAEIACAGHPAPIFVPGAGAPAPVAAEGDLLGVLPTIGLRTAEMELHPGESLAAYTDGVTDQGSDLRLDPEAALAERAAEADAEQLAGILERLSGEREARQRDDVAILVLRFLGGPADQLEPAMPASHLEARVNA